MRTLFAFCLSIIAAVASAQSGWETIVPEPNLSFATGVVCFDSSTTVTVGDAGLLMHTSNGGASWSGYTTTLSNMNAVMFIDRSTGFAVGESGTIVKSTDGGAHWIIVNSQTSETLLSVYMVSSSAIYVASQQGTIFTSTNGGTSWTKQHSGTRNDLRSIYFINSQTGYAVGTGVTLRTTNAGAVWSGVLIDSTQTWNAISFVNASVGILQGGTQIYHTADSGQHWSAFTFSPYTIHHLNYTKFFSKDSGIAVAQIAELDTHYAYIFHTYDGGQHWSTSGTKLLLFSRAYSFISDQIGFGNDGVSRTTDGGTSWQSSSNSPGNVYYQCAAFATKLLGVAAASIRNSLPSDLYQTTDGGVSWSYKTSLTQHVSSISMPDAKHITVVGTNGFISNTTNGGLAWIPEVSNTTKPLLSVAFADTNNGMAVGGYVNSPTGQDTVQQYRVILHTTNGGATWTKVFEGSGLVLNAVAMHDSLHAIAVGLQGAIIRTNDAGATWSEQHLTNHAPLNSVTYMNAATISAVGATSVIVRSADSGATWAFQSVAKPTSTTLYSVSFSDLNNGLATGAIGSVFHTTNGGTQWYPEYTGSLADLLSVNMFDADSAIAVGGIVIYDPNYIPVILRNTTLRQSTTYSKSKQQIDFGLVQLGTSKTDSFTLVNTGIVAIILNSIITSNPYFTVDPGNCIIAPGDSLKFYTSFIPATIVDQNGSVLFYRDGVTGPDSITLHGMGYGGPVIGWNHRITFGDVRAGSTKSDSMILFNVGDRSLSISNINIPDTSFTLREHTASIAAGDSMILHVQFTPVDYSAHDAYVTFTHNGVTSPDSEIITGRGVGPISNKQSIDFGNVAIGVAKVDSFYLINTIEPLLVIDSIVCADPAYTIKPNKPSLNMGDTVPVHITFRPTAIKTFASQIIIHHAAINISDTVNITGNGVGPLFAVSTRFINFGSVPAFTTKTDSFVVSNPGSAPLIIASMYSDNNVFVVSPDSLTISAGDSAMIYVAFTPTHTIHDTSLVIINDNAATSPDTIRLVGDLLTGVADNHTISPTSALLIDNYPNPFSQSTVFQISAPVAAMSTVRIYSILGNEIATLLAKQLESGSYVLPFDAHALPAGVYHVVVTNGNVHAEKAFVIAK